VIQDCLAPIGYGVSVPGLPGCWSQGASENEALENIRDAIREYLSLVDDQLRAALSTSVRWRACQPTNFT